MARPKKEIPQDQFEKLCGLMCTEAEICAFFDTTDKTLNAWCKRTYKKPFSEVYRQKSEAGKIAIRRAQLHLAEKNAAMAIFLGKNYLGQTDVQKVEIEGQIEQSQRELEAYLNGRTEKTGS